MHYLTRQFAEQQAENDYLEYCRLTGRSNTLIVDPCYLAEVLWDTDVVFLDEGVLGGENIAFAHLATNQIVVEVSGFDPRDRFSTAHEVGHMSLHRYLLQLGELGLAQEKLLEFQADTYASSLLMPKESVLKVIQSSSSLLDNDAYRINTISNKFHVSKIAARIRLEGLNLVSNPNMKKVLNTYENDTQQSRDAWFTQQ